MAVSATAPAGRLREGVRRVAEFAGGYPLAVGSVLLVSAILLPLRPYLPVASIMLFYVPVIVGVARLAGVRPSSLAGLLAFFAIDLLFVAPYYRLTVTSPSEWTALVVFLFVAVVTGRQAGAMGERERAAVRRRDELAALNRLSFRVASETSGEAIAASIVGEVTRVSGARRAALYGRAEPPIGASPIATAGPQGPIPGEAELVRWVMRQGKAVGLPPAPPGVTIEERPVSVPVSEALPDSTAAVVCLPLHTASGLEGVLVVVRGAETGQEDSRLLVALSNLAAAALERHRLAGEASHAQALREADRLRSTLVSSVSHELKTPLAAATARVTGLVEEDGACDDARVHAELTEVAEDLARLDASIGDLLDLSRLESAAWQPHFERYDVREILGTVLARLPRAQRPRVRFDVTQYALEADVDFAQLARALTNLLENALAYSPAPEEVIVRARGLMSGGLEVAVEDHGPGVPDEEKDHVFEKFFRGSAAGAVPRGTGLGLAIASEIVKTHGGTLRLEDAVPHGARFVLTLPPSEEGRR